MQNKWPTVELSELSKEITVGFVGSMTHEYVDSGIPFLRSKNIDEHSIKWDDIRYISPEFHIKLKKSALKPGDVAIVRTGKPGTTCVIPESLPDANCSDLVIVRVDEKRLNPHFLSYFMNSVAAGQQVNSHVVGAVQQHFNVGSAKKIHVPSPSIEEQDKVVGVLKTLDDKIQLNRQTNQTLENMAQALFKSWFVDFDPVIDNALAAGNTIPEPLQLSATRRAEQRKALQESDDASAPLPESIRQLFPSEFVFDAEMGWIPEGWEVKQLSEVTTELRRGISPKYLEEGGVPVVNQKCIRGHELNFDLCRRNNPELRKIVGRELQIGDLLINSTGVGTLGRMAMVKYLEETTVVDSHVTVVRPDTSIYPMYAFAQMMLSLEPQIEALGEGSTGQTELSRKIVSEKMVLVPPTDITSIIDKHLLGFAEKSVSNIKQIKELAKLRDTLLPKLISGELRIPEAQQQAEAAVA